MNKQTSYIFSFKVLRIPLFILVLVILTNTIIHYFVKPSTDRTLAINLETLKNQKFDVLFLSNSYLYTAYDPLLIKSLTGLDAIHLGSSARRLCFEPFILRNALKYQQPSVVVIDISSTTITTPNSDKSWYFNNKALSNYPLSVKKLGMLWDLIPSKRYDLWMQSFSKTTRTLYNLSAEETLTYYPKDETGFWGKTLGFEPKNGQNSISLENYQGNFQEYYTKLPATTSTKYNVLDELTKDKIIELVKISNQNPQIEFILVNNVKIDASIENQHTLNKIKELTKSCNNVAILELNTKKAKEDMNLNFEDFHDPIHLTQSGAIKATSYFSSFLNQNYRFVKTKINKDDTHTFTIGKTGKKIIVKDIQVLNKLNYRTDIRVLINDFPEGYDEVNTVVSIYPKEGLEHLLEDKSKKNKWYSDNAYRKLKNYTKIDEGYVGKLNSWSKLTPEDIERIELRFIENGFSSEIVILQNNKVNILK